MHSISDLISNSIWIPSKRYWETHLVFSTTYHHYNGKKLSILTKSPQYYPSRHKWPWNVWAKGYTSNFIWKLRNASRHSSTKSPQYYHVLLHANQRTLITSTSRYGDWRHSLTTKPNTQILQVTNLKNHTVHSSMELYNKFAMTQLNTKTVISITTKQCRGKGKWTFK